MPITRCSDQPSKTLAEFYSSIGLEASSEAVMLSVLDMIDSTFKRTEIYGLTSHTTLILLREDSSWSPWYVKVYGSEGEYYIEYLLPPSKRPWSHAYVSGTAKSLPEFRDMLLIAMRESEGWLDCEELISLTSNLSQSKPDLQ